MIQLAAERQDDLLSGVFFGRRLIVEENNTEFIADEKVRRQTLIASEEYKAYPIARVKEAYQKSKESALRLLQSMLSLIEAYVVMPSNLKSVYEVECYNDIDQFIYYIEDTKTGSKKYGFKQYIHTTDSYELLIRQRPGPKTAMDAAQKAMSHLMMSTKGEEGKEKALALYTKRTKGAEGKEQGTARKLRKEEKKEKRKLKGRRRAMLAWETMTRDHSHRKERETKSTGKSVRARTTYNLKSSTIRRGFSIKCKTDEIEKNSTNQNEGIRKEDKDKSTGVEKGKGSELVSNTSTWKAKLKEANTKWLNRCVSH